MAAGRLVLHGWFSDPEPFWSGGLAAEAQSEGGAAGAVLDSALASAVGSLGQVGRVTGCLSVRVTVSGSHGRVVAVDALADSLVPDPEDFVGAIGETDLGETVRQAPLVFLFNLLTCCRSGLSRGLKRCCRSDFPLLSGASPFVM
jgi:hypothetical protein